MKKILVFLAFVATCASLQAELKILTVDMAELYNSYYRAQEARDKFNSSVENAQDEITQMIDEGRKLAEQYQDLVAKAKNPALTEEARAKSAEEAEAVKTKIIAKEAEVNNFKQQADEQLASRRQSTINLHVDEIREVVKKMAQERGADFVFNVKGSVVYAKDGVDITADVLKVLNADKPQS